MKQTRSKIKDNSQTRKKAWCIQLKSPRLEDWTRSTKSSKARIRRKAPGALRHSFRKSTKKSGRLAQRVAHRRRLALSNFPLCGDGVYPALKYCKYFIQDCRSLPTHVGEDGARERIPFRDCHHVNRDLRVWERVRVVRPKRPDSAWPATANHRWPTTYYKALKAVLTTSENHSAKFSELRDISEPVTHSTAPKLVTLSIDNGAVTQLFVVKRIFQLEKLLDSRFQWI